LDPKGFEYPHESYYAFSGNSPIFFLDPDGNKKTTYVKIIAENGQEQYLKLVDNDYVKEVVVGKRRIGYFDEQEHNEYDDYDVIVFVEINLQTNRISQSEENVTEKTKAWYESPGKDSDQNYGEALTSKEFEGEMNKYNGNSKTPAKSMNIDALTGIRGGGSLTEKNMRKMVNVIKESFSSGTNLVDIYNKATGAEIDLGQPIGFNCKKCEKVTGSRDTFPMEIQSLHEGENELIYEK